MALLCLKNETVSCTLPSFYGMNISAAACSKFLTHACSLSHERMNAPLLKSSSFVKKWVGGSIVGTAKDAEVIATALRQGRVGASFIVVREPLERMMSAYSTVLKGSLKLQQQRKIGGSAAAAFEFLHERDPIKRFEHWVETVVRNGDALVRNRVRSAVQIRLATRLWSRVLGMVTRSLGPCFCAPCAMLHRLQRTNWFHESMHESSLKLTDWLANQRR